jgi:lipoprotein-anchoring transpeptidase ErfK/SrfK
MKLRRLQNLVLAIATTAVGLPAFAVKAEVTAKPRIDLEDVLTTDEIAADVPAPQAKLYKSDFWKGSKPDPRLQIVVDKAERGTSIDAQTLEAYVDGALVFKFKVSTGAEKPIITTSGKPSNRITPAGKFSIDWRDIDHVSSVWTDASMPFAQFFYKGIAIHATTPNHYRALGRRDSGGCVRLHPTNAALMWELVKRMGTRQAVVYVYDGSISPHPLGRGGEMPAMQSQETMTEQQLDAAVGTPGRHSSADEEAEREAVRQLNLKMAEQYRLQNTR